MLKIKTSFKMIHMSLYIILGSLIFWGCEKGKNIATGEFNNPCLTSDNSFCATVFVPDETITKIEVFGINKDNSEIECIESQQVKLKPNISFGKVFNIQTNMCSDKNVSEYQFVRVHAYAGDNPTNYIYFYAPNLRIANNSEGILKFSATADAQIKVNGVPIEFLLPIENYKNIQELLKTPEDVKQFAIEIGKDPEIQKFTQELALALQSGNSESEKKPYEINPTVVSRFIQIASAQGQNKCTQIFDYSSLPANQKAQYPDYETVSNCFDRENFLNDFEIHRNPCDQKEAIKNYENKSLLYTKIFNNLREFCSKGNYKDNFDEFWDEEKFEEIKDNRFDENGFFRVEGKLFKCTKPKCKNKCEDPMTYASSICLPNGTKKGQYSNKPEYAVNLNATPHSPEFYCFVEPSQSECGKCEAKCEKWNNNCWYIPKKNDVKE